MIDLKDIFYEFSSRNALELIRKISGFHRAKGSLEYSKARETIQNYLKNSTLLTFPMDKTYNTWQSPPSWNLNGGYLKYQNGKYIVSDLSLTPISAIFLSDKTDGVEKLEVFDVGKGETEEDYKNFEPGNAVLADGNPTLVYHYAIEKFNARCVLSYHMKAQDKSIGRTPELLPDTINYTSFPSFKNKYAFGYALSYDQFKELKERLKKEKVYIEAFLDADQGTNNLEVLQENIGKDTDQPAVILTAHLCHPKPGANDNASGSALLAEIMKVLEKFQNHLNRKIIGLWVAEMYGTAAYSTTEFPKNAYVINLDMVGEDQFKTGSTLKLTPSPWAIPSFLAELLYVN
ncbi:MAG: M28 family peptidase, partial [Thermotogota bacterium]|nr:M28 family peptidase [Thermotogota bacterium]